MSRSRRSSRLQTSWPGGIGRISLDLNSIILGQNCLRGFATEIDLFSASVETCIATSPSGWEIVFWVVSTSTWRIPRRQFHQQWILGVQKQVLDFFLTSMRLFICSGLPNPFAFRAKCVFDCFGMFFIPYTVMDSGIWGNDSSAWVCSAHERALLEQGTSCCDGEIFTARWGDNRKPMSGACDSHNTHRANGTNEEIWKSRWKYEIKFKNTYIYNVWYVLITVLV